MILSSPLSGLENLSVESEIRVTQCATCLCLSSAERQSLTTTWRQIPLR